MSEPIAMSTSVTSVLEKSAPSVEQTFGLAPVPRPDITVLGPRMPAPTLSPAIPETRVRRTRTWLIGVDITAAGLAATLALVADTAGRGGTAWAGAMVFSLSVVLLNGASRDYVASGAPAFLDDLPGVLGRTLLAFGLSAVASLVAGAPVSLAMVAGFLTVALLGRAVGFAIVRHRRRRGGALRPTVVVGAGPLARRLATAMREHPELGREPLGFLEDRVPQQATDLGFPILGDVASLPTLLECSPQLDAIVADTTMDEADVVEVIQRCDRLSGEIYVVPRLAAVQAIDGESIAGLPLTRLPRRSHRAPQWRLKRLVDITAAGIGLVLVSPLMALLALLVLIEGGRGVFFRQERVGIDGRYFDIIKFRSLRPAAPEDSAERWSIQGDPGLGPVGKALRTLSLDELPQLWNVLKGDMSLVGPRPERPYFVTEFSTRYPHYQARHRVNAGITGAAQISGLRGDTDISERAHCDNAYITSWSLWGDVKIMIRTAGKLVTKAGG